VVVGMLAYLCLITVTAILRPIVFAFEPIFGLINYLIWFLHNPLRFAQKNIKTGTSRGLSLTLALTGISLIWMVFIYIVLTPLRILTALYYDIILFSAVSLSDNLQELINPKIGNMKYKKGISYVFFYIVTFPFRLLMFVINGGAYVLDSFLMFGVSVAVPTLTMRHGTNFKEAGSKIAQTGGWLVGKGNYAGTGIYFGMNDRVAKHYAPAGGNAGVVMVRVTLTFCKTLSALSKSKREVGLGDRGERLAVNVSKSKIFSSVEHYRENGGWWEYCILQAEKMGSYVSSWRIRPVALIRDGKITRTYGGFSHYSASGGLVAGVLSWFYLLFVFVSIVV